MEKILICKDVPPGGAVCIKVVFLVKYKTILKKIKGKESHKEFSY